MTNLIHYITIFISILLFNSTLIAQNNVPSPNHLVVVILENNAIQQIVGNPYMPYLNSLLTDPKAAVFTKSYALTHPSQPNYIQLFSGNSQNVTDNELPANLPFKTCNLGASLIQNGKTFKGYSQDLPSIGFTGTNYQNYARKHNPWVNWQDADTNGISYLNNLPFSHFPTNFDSLPTISFVVPNQEMDLHNNPNDTTTYLDCDNWLQTNIDPYVQWCKNNNSMVIFTFDEDNYNYSNHILTFFIGSMVEPGIYNDSINHYTLLRTLEEMYNLPYCGKSIQYEPIKNCWTPCSINYQPKIIGNQIACKNQSYLYSVKPREGSTYTWTVTGGILVSGQGSPIIQVDWGEEQIGNVSIIQTFTE